jgi:hypothetical protein
MPAATPQQLAQMDAAVAELHGQYNRAWPKVDANTGGWWTSPEQDAIRKAFLDMGALLDKWATTYRAWAANGQRDDGTEYSVQRFLDFGRTDLGDAVEKISAEAYDRSLFAALKYTVTETGKQLNPLNWPMKWKLAAGVGVAGLLVLAVAVVARR